MNDASAPSDTMRAVRLHGPGDVRVESIPRPTPADGQVPLRMRSVGLCGSDLHHYREGTTGSEVHSEPFVLGHEISAEVPDESADQLGLEPGGLVAVNPAHPCGECEWCARGHPNLCPHVEFKGVVGDPGGLAERLTAHPRQVVPVPDDMGPDAAALLEPLGVAIHAVDLAEIQVMDTVAVLGAGPIGLLVAQVVQAAGAGECVIVDPLSYRTEVAKKLGADRTATHRDAIEAWAGGRGADVVIEATNAPEGFEHAVESVRIGGCIVLVGIPEGNEYGLTAAPARRKGITVKFCRRMGEVYDRAIQLVTSGRVDLEPIVTHRVPLEEAPEALALQSRYEDNVIKAVVYHGRSD